MEPALVSQDGSWHQNMLGKWLDKNNRIRPGVFKEVCWRLIKDSDLCSLHQKKQILCFLKNGTWELGCDVQYIRQRAQNKYRRVNKKQEMKNTGLVWQFYVISLKIIFNSEQEFVVFVLECRQYVSVRDCFSWCASRKHIAHKESLCRYCSWFVY